MKFKFRKVEVEVEDEVFEVVFQRSEKYVFFEVEENVNLEEEHKVSILKSEDKYSFNFFVDDKKIEFDY